MRKKKPQAPKQSRVQPQAAGCKVHTVREPLKINLQIIFEIGEAIFKGLAIYFKTKRK